MGQTGCDTLKDETMKKIIVTILIILFVGVNVQSADGDGGYAGTF